MSALDKPGLQDVGIVIDAFHHFADPAAVLRSVRKVLRPGGRLVVAGFARAARGAPRLRRTGRLHRW